MAIASGTCLYDTACPVDRIVYLSQRGWSHTEIDKTIAEGPKGTSIDRRRADKTPDGLPRNDPATVYGKPGNYVVVNDRTKEITQISGRNDSDWVDDSRIKWRK